MRLMAEKNLIDLDVVDIPINIPSISTARHNPFDFPYDDFLGLLLLYCCQDEILLTFLMTPMKKSPILREIVFNRNSLQLNIGNHFSEGMKVSALGHQPWRGPGKIFDGSHILYPNDLLLKGQAITLSSAN